MALSSSSAAAADNQNVEYYYYEDDYYYDDHYEDRLARPASKVQETGTYVRMYEC